MGEAKPSAERIILEEGDGIIIYKEPCLDGWVTVAETELETLRVYDDGSHSYTLNRSGTRTTYYPDDRYVMELPGEPIIEGKTQFKVTGFE